MSHHFIHSTFTHSENVENTLRLFEAGKEDGIERMACQHHQPVTGKLPGLSSHIWKGDG
jgi:hypothetical protein